jgi:hypothetical protein
MGETACLDCTWRAFLAFGISQQLDGASWPGFSTCSCHYPPARWISAALLRFFSFFPPVFLFALVLCILEVLMATKSTGLFRSRLVIRS